MDNNELREKINTIPVTIDSVKNIETYKMTRCTYFSIENNDSEKAWTLRTEKFRLNFLMIDLSGIILSPLNGEDGLLFSSPEKYDDLFQMIEENNELYIDMNDIWLPNQLFFHSNIQPKRGDVYRINFDLFKIAYLLRDEVKSDKEFFRIMKNKDIPLLLEFSEEETNGLKLWNEQQIEINRVEYHENIQPNLPKKEDDQKPFPTLTI